MLEFHKANIVWWNKPLVKHGENIFPAELAVLSIEINLGEEGLWLNSRGIKSGVMEFDPKLMYTIRKPIPSEVANTLQHLYSLTGLSKGCPDLVIWNTSTRKIRFVEVKCPHWDRPTKEQEIFIRTAAGQGIATSIVEWEFADHSGH